jgi:hypothetical protein
MPAPNLTITVEPTTSNAVMFLPLAPKTANDPAQGEIALEFTLANHEAVAVHVTTLTISFVGSPAMSTVNIPMNLNIPSHGVMGWSFDKSNDIVTPFPAPGQVHFSFTCQGFSQPAVLQMPLIAAGPPVPGGFDFPAKASDLHIGEYWSGQSLTHDAGANGSQLFAYDMVVVGLDPSSHIFSNLLPGTNNTNNSDSRIWGKPIYAVADGVVLEAENSVPNNPAPLSWTSAADLNAKLAAQAANVWNKPQFKNPGGGNHFYLQHGDHAVLYAHMQQGSLNPALQKAGTAVKRGQFLALPATRETPRGRIRTSTPSRAPHPKSGRSARFRIETCGSSTRTPLIRPTQAAPGSGRTIRDFRS